MTNKEIELRLLNLEKMVSNLAERTSNRDNKNEGNISTANSEISALEEKTSCITITTMQSDKLGYDWKITKVGDIEASKEYIPQADPKGISADNPIIWEDGMTPINNAFYEKDGKIVVYMDGEWIDWEA